jgi:hypothetical protein
LENTKLVTETLAKEIFNRKSTPHILLEQQINLDNLVEILPATVDPDKIAQLKHCLADDSPILGYKFRPLTGIWATAQSTIKEIRSREISIPVPITTTQACQRPIVKRSWNI